MRFRVRVRVRVRVRGCRDVSQSSFLYVRLASSLYVCPGQYQDSILSTSITHIVTTNTKSKSKSPLPVFYLHLCICHDDVSDTCR